jgi:hypothetical protein
VHAVHHRQRLVRDLQPQYRQRDQYPVGEYQLMATAGAFRALALAAAARAKADSRRACQGSARSATS